MWDQGMRTCPVAKEWASRAALVVKSLPAKAGDVRDAGSIPGSGRFPGGGNGNPFQYSCLENPTDRRTWRATVHGVAKSWTWLKWHSTRISWFRDAGEKGMKSGGHPTQRSNPGLPLCRQMLYHLNHQRSPPTELGPYRWKQVEDVMDSWIHTTVSSILSGLRAEWWATGVQEVWGERERWWMNFRKQTTRAVLLNIWCRNESPGDIVEVLLLLLSHFGCVRLCAIP